MRRTIWIILIISVPLYSLAQNEGTLGVEFSVGYNQFDMEELNKSTDEVFDAYDAQINRSKLKRGMNYAFELNIQPHKIFSLGLFSNYQEGRAENEFQLINEGSFGLPNDTVRGSYNQISNSIVIGVKSTLIINNFNFWKEKKWLSNIQSNIDLGFGYSFSALSSYSIHTSIPVGGSREINKVSGLNFNGSLKLGYIISNSVVFSSVGIRLGYQYLITSRLDGGINYFFDESNAPRLNFSGLNGGIFLTFAK